MYAATGVEGCRTMSLRLILISITLATVGTFLTGAKAEADSLNRDLRLPDGIHVVCAFGFYKSAKRGCLPVKCQNPSKYGCMDFGKIKCPSNAVSWSGICLTPKKSAKKVVKKKVVRRKIVKKIKAPKILKPKVVKKVVVKKVVHKKKKKGGLDIDIDTDGKSKKGIKKTVVKKTKVKIPKTFAKKKVVKQKVVMKKPSLKLEPSLKISKPVKLKTVKHKVVKKKVVKKGAKKSSNGLLNQLKNLAEAVSKNVKHVQVHIHHHDKGGDNN